MKNIIKLFSVLILVFFLYKAINQQITYNLLENEYGFKHKVKMLNREDDWGVNGDGVSLVYFSFKEHLELDSTFIKAPIISRLPPNEIPKRFLSIKNGFYKKKEDRFDESSFGILIIDTEANEICLYNQIQ